MIKLTKGTWGLISYIVTVLVAVAAFILIRTYVHPISYSFLVLYIFIGLVVNTGEGIVESIIFSVIVLAFIILPVYFISSKYTSLWIPWVVASVLIPAKLVAAFMAEMAPKDDK